MARKALLCLLGLAVATGLGACGASSSDQITIHGQIWERVNSGESELVSQASVSTYIYVPVTGPRQGATSLATTRSDANGRYAMTTGAAYADQRIVFTDDLTGASAEVAITGLTPGANVTVNPTLSGMIAGSIVDGSASGQFVSADAYVYIAPM